MCTSCTHLYIMLAVLSSTVRLWCTVYLQAVQASQSTSSGTWSANGLGCLWALDRAAAYW